MKTHSAFGSVIFVRTGWMRFYDGKQPGDERPIGGGRYNKTRIGHEQFNFRDVRGQLYGYFQPQMKSQGINLRRVTGKETKSPARRVLVVWVAGGVVIGWFRDATLFATAQTPVGQAASLRRRFKFYCTASVGNSVLLPRENRTIRIPQGSKGGMGRVNVRYTRNSKGETESQPWMEDVLQRIRGYIGDNLLIDSTVDATSAMEDEFFSSVSRGPGQGIGGTPQQRKAVESRAESLATTHFKNEGFTVVKHGKPFDLECTKGKTRLYVEVKGTRSGGEKVFLTAGEVRFANENSKNMVLFVVRSIKLRGSSRKPEAYGGTKQVISSWRPARKDLTELSYSYTVP